MLMLSGKAKASPYHRRLTANTAKASPYHRRLSANTAEFHSGTPCRPRRLQQAASVNMTRRDRQGKPDRRRIGDKEATS